MGWTGVSVYELNVDKKGNYDRKAYLDKEYVGESEKYIWELLKSAMVGSTWYGAVKRINKETGEFIVYTGVTLTSIEGNEFYYKDMSEFMGPYNYNCPVGILNLLTETDSEFALEWREKCRKQIAEKNFRNQFFKIAKNKAKIKYIKYTLPRDFNEEYKKGDEVYLSWNSYLVKGKLRNCWGDGVYKWSQKYIEPNSCILIMQDGSEMLMAQAN